LEEDVKSHCGVFAARPAEEDGFRHLTAPEERTGHRDTEAQRYEKAGRRQRRRRLTGPGKP
jgi:hypothetical protein